MVSRFRESWHNDWSFFKSAEYVVISENGVKVDLKTNYKTYGADLPIDIDSKAEKIEVAVKYSKKEAAKIIKFLDKMECPFICSYSGRQGFHITIEWKALQLHMAHDLDQIKSIAKFITKKARGTLRAKAKKDHAFVDIGITGRPKGLIRVHNSLHPKSLLVALPLTRDNFEDFTLEMVNPYYVMNKIIIRDRRPVWNEQGDTKELIESAKVSVKA